MGAAAASFSDVVIVTSDNPRNEQPEDIIADVIPGFETAVRPVALSKRESATIEIEADRSLAIRKALNMAASGDVVLIAGKGHEDYQLIGKEKVYFSDRDEIRKFYA